MEDIRAANPRNHNHFGYVSAATAIELATFLFRASGRTPADNHIMGHLYFKRYPEVPPISPSGFAVLGLAKMFGLSPRQTCRVLLGYQQAMERDLR
jgi:hypothetical protein